MGAFPLLYLVYFPILMRARLYIQTLWLLANDKESQDRLRAEVRPIFAENPHPDYRTLKSLQWLDCVVFVLSNVVENPTLR